MAGIKKINEMQFRIKNAPNSVFFDIMYTLADCGHRMYNSMNAGIYVFMQNIRRPIWQTRSW